MMYQGLEPLNAAPGPFYIAPDPPLTSDRPRKPHILPSDANATSPEHPIFFCFFLDYGAFDLVYSVKEHAGGLMVVHVNQGPALAAWMEGGKVKAQYSIYLSKAG